MQWKALPALHETKRESPKSFEHVITNMSRAGSQNCAFACRQWLHKCTFIFLTCIFHDIFGFHSTNFKSHFLQKAGWNVGAKGIYLYCPSSAKRRSRRSCGQDQPRIPKKLITILELYFLAYVTSHRVYTTKMWDIYHCKWVVTAVHYAYMFCANERNALRCF